MKIALLTDGIHPYVIGGMQKHSFYLAKYFAKNRVQVDLYHTNKSRFEINKLEFFSDEEKKFIRSFVVDFPVFRKFPGHYIRESFEYSRRIFELFRKNSEVDFIYAKGFCGWKLIDEKKKGFQCASIGVNFHGYEMFQKAPSLKSIIEQRIFLRNPVFFNARNSDFVFSYGGKITDIILEIGIDAGKIIEIPAGIESSWIIDKIKTAGQKRKFLFVGRYERRKGIEELYVALNEIIKEYDFEFHFVGPIPDNKKIKCNNVIYHGSISETKMMKTIYDNCDILVVPSYSEGMPNVILEAMASGLSIIATDVGAVNLLISSSAGWLIKPNNKLELKKAMINAIELPEYDLNVLKQNSAAHIRQNFLMDQIITKLIKHISLLK